MQRFVNDNFIPVKIHIKERPQDFKRFKAEWTPTLIIAEPDGTERYRFEGYLPPDDFLAKLALGLAKASFSRGEFQEAQRRFSDLAGQYPNSEVAPEAVYWSSVSDYKMTGKADALQKAGQILHDRYPTSDWAKKASVWLDSSSRAA